MMIRLPHEYWDSLWHPYKSLDSHYNQVRCNQTKNRLVKVWNSFDEYSMPELIDWKANPFNNKTWELYFNSLNWLYALFWGIDNEGESPEILHRYVIDYCTYLDIGDVGEMAWFDHATSDRLCFLSMVLSHPSSNELSGNARRLIDKVVFTHISKIREFYDSKFWFNSNHGVFHALSLINISQIHPFGNSEFGIAGLGIKYLDVSLKGIIDIDEAISLEQSLYYHQLAINLLETIPTAVFRKIDFSFDIGELIERMKHVNYWFTLSGTTMPGIGDSAINANVPLDYLIPRTADYSSMTFVNGGFSIVKEVKNKDEINHFTMLHRESRAPHGHYDSLSVTLSHNGQQFIIDSGGPFNYGEPLRFSYFMSNRGHNLIMLGGNTHESGAELLETENHGNGVYSIAAQHRGYEPIIHRRQSIYIEKCGVIIVDILKRVEENCEYDILWHIHPDCGIDKSGQIINFQSESQNLVMHVPENIADLFSVVSGVDGKNPQGWMTEGIAQKVPIPTIIFSGKTACDTAITSFFQFGDIEVEDVIFLDGGGIHIIQQNRKIRVNINDDFSTEIIIE